MRFLTVPNFIRAWAYIDLATTADVTGTYSQSGTTVTVTITNHGMRSGHYVYLDFTSGTATDASFQVTVVDANTFTVTRGSATTSGNVTLKRAAFSGYGISDISKAATGDYFVNFKNDMPDLNYAISTTSKCSSNTATHVGEESLDSARTVSSIRMRSSFVNTAQNHTAVDTQVSIMALR